MERHTHERMPLWKRNTMKHNEAAAARQEDRSTTSTNNFPAPTATSTRNEWLHQQHQTAMIIASSLTSMGSRSAHAVCLPGETRTDCIGVYKQQPLLSAAPSMLSPQSALEQLQTQQLAAADIQQVVSQGRLEEAGMKVLRLLPMVQQSGRVLVDAVEGSSSSSSSVQEVRMMQLQSQFETMVAQWGQADVALGQGIRGQMGVSAVAQLQILSALQDATVALDDFVALARSAF